MSKTTTKRKSRRVTLRNIGEACGVSYATVSMALRGDSRIHEATWKRVVETARQMGYRPNYLARSLQSQSSGVLGCIIPSALKNPIPPLLEYLYRAAFKAGYQLELYMSQNDIGQEIRALDRCLGTQVEGVILYGITDSLESLPEDHPAHLMVADNFPCVLVNSSDFPLARVSTNSAQAATLATGHLIDQGYPQLRLLVLSDNMTRVNAFEQALTKTGFDYHPDWVMKRSGQFETLTRISDTSGAISQSYFDYDRVSEYGYELGRRAVESAGGEPVGLVCQDDLVASGAQRYCQSHEIPPDQVGIVGCDDGLAKHLGITSVHWDYQAMSHTIVHSLRDQIAGRNLRPLTLIDGQLIARRSSQRKASPSASSG